MKLMFGKIIKIVYWLSLLFFSSQGIFAAEQYALVVGIDKYPASRNLNGSVRDANHVADFFTSIKFKEVKILVNEQATRNEILTALTYFQKKVNSGDTFYFYFAGHGTIVLDSNSDDRDEFLSIKSTVNPETGKSYFPEGKYDSAICPYDHKTKSKDRKYGSNILDDELFKEFAEFAAKDCYTVLISDSCHSGTLGRTLDSRSYRFLLPSEAYDEPLPDNTSSGSTFTKMFTITTPEKRLEQLKGKFFALTAAKDNQLSEEFYFDSVKGEMGIFTHYLLEILEKNREITFGELIPELDKRVSKKSKGQTAQLEKRFFNGDLEKIKLLSPR